MKKIHVSKQLYLQLEGMFPYIIYIFFIKFNCFCHCYWYSNTIFEFLVVVESHIFVPPLEPTNSVHLIIFFQMKTIESCNPTCYFFTSRTFLFDQFMYIYLLLNILTLLPTIYQDVILG